MLKHVLTLSIIFTWIFSQAQITAVRGEFTDQNLLKLLDNSGSKKASGVIYSWSPKMPLSELGVEELAEIATRLKIPLTIVLDPNVPEAEVLAASKGNLLLKDSLKLKSATLTAMSMKIHYPSLVIYKNGQLLSPSRPGYDEPERVEEYLIRRLK